MILGRSAVPDTVSAAALVVCVGAIVEVEHLTQSRCTTIWSRGNLDPALAMNVYQSVVSCDSMPPLFSLCHVPSKWVLSLSFL